MSLYASELICPLCQSGELRATYLPPSKRFYIVDEEEVTEHWGEVGDVKCSNCEFEFTFSTDQES